MGGTQRRRATKNAIGNEHRSGAVRECNDHLDSLEGLYDSMTVTAPPDDRLRRKLIIFEDYLPTR